MVVLTNAHLQSQARVPAKHQRTGGHVVPRALRQRTMANARITFPAKAQPQHRVGAIRWEDEGLLMAQGEGSRNVPLAVKVNQRVVMEENIPDEGEGMHEALVIRLDPEPLRPGNLQPAGLLIETITFSASVVDRLIFPHPACFQTLALFSVICSWT